MDVAAVPEQQELALDPSQQPPEEARDLLG
jgi:hypothetical protein